MAGLSDESRLTRLPGSFVRLQSLGPGKELRMCSRCGSKARGEDEGIKKSGEENLWLRPALMSPSKYSDPVTKIVKTGERRGKGASRGSSRQQGGAPLNKTLGV
ncbi:unnamed protein product [Pleuronectes platessa]|uniref:Uncharacterized protein n=1 Tax=Pleuronectes platessa TaxID=8262 RepID=A0A9N7U5I9_PLEPL|nr:unnamed protein product [Pleuronectes platessa]